MSSAYKTLKTSDITVSPYRAYKTYTITNSNYSNYKVEILSGSNTTTSPTYKYYRSARLLYYSYNKPSLGSRIPTSEQNYNQLEENQNNPYRTNTTLAYNNYQQSTAASGTLEYDSREGFPTASGEEIRIISIPQNLFGEAIKPTSFKYTGQNISFTDDGNGNLIDTAYNKVGNLIYSHGIGILTDQTAITNYNNSSNWTITFAATLTIYENQIRCHVNENEFNQTLNPSALSGSVGTYSNNLTGSEFDPYVTAVGLYSAASELLAIGKLTQPYPVPSNTDITFTIRYDS